MSSNSKPLPSRWYSVISKYEDEPQVVCDHIFAKGPRVAASLSRQQRSDGAEVIAVIRGKHLLEDI
jgi:hypothetical protein